MGKPAARLTDMHTCPMVTPGMPPIPHVGGPISGPCVPPVLIGFLPAATVGDMCVCVGPPDTIAMGSPTVFIGGKMAARMGDPTMHGGVITVGCPTVLIGEGGSGGAGGGGGGSVPRVNLASPSGLLSGLFGVIEKLAELVRKIAESVAPSTPLADSKVQELMKKSPTLTKNIDTLLADNWTIRYGKAGGGTFCDKENKEIVLDPDNKNPTGVVQSLAHESGHALYTADPYVPPDGLTREAYVEANVKSNLKDEGEATLTNAQVRDEILANGGDDIGIAGAKEAEYKKAYEEYSTEKDRDAAREKIGGIFANGENPSTDTSKTYRDYYAKPFEDYYDQNVTKKP